MRIGQKNVMVNRSALKEKVEKAILEKENKRQKQSFRVYTWGWGLFLSEPSFMSHSSQCLGLGAQGQQLTPRRWKKDHGHLRGQPNKAGLDPKVLYHV